MQVNLSKTELEIMEFFWKSNAPLSRKEITYYFNEVVKKDWKRQTINTFLVRLTEKEFIVREGKAYVILIDKKGYETLKAKTILDTMYHGSLKEFVVALSGNEIISQEEAAEIRELLNEMK